MGLPITETLLSGSTGVATGATKNVGEALDATVQAVGIVSDTILIEGSNQPTPTTWATLQTITADGVYAIEALPIWIRARHSVDGTGTVSIFLRAGR